ncbi:MAG: multiple sugar transport system substrate-binding protein [Gemmatimonadaceae bacterium]|nr:multiple sugar transport system substrate-binding protein [Gemmatimonadaceae bacterium]
MGGGKAIMTVARSLTALAIIALAGITVGCGRRAELTAAPRGPAPLGINLDHLRHLGMNAVVRGKPVRMVSLYAEAPDYRLVGSPARDGFEGIASVDDAARAAVVYLREYEITGEGRSHDEALGLLAFITSMEQGDGEFVNFIDSAGRLNLKAASSRKSMSYWAARSIWALGEAVRVLGPRDSVDLKSIRLVLDRALVRMGREIDGGRLIGESTTATAEALLGVLAAQKGERPAASLSLAQRTADLLATKSAGTAKLAPWGAHLDGPGAAWHAWGARSVEALASAQNTLGGSEYGASARKEADGLWGRFLLAGQIPSEVASDGTAMWYPEIAYGIGSIVDGYLALAEISDDPRYAVFAGLTAGWFLGANPERLDVYDEKTGRTFDGIDGPTPLKLNRNAGAESTVEALLALQRVSSNPIAAEYLRYRPVGELSSSLANVPNQRKYVGPSGDTLILSRGLRGVDIVRRATTPITLTYWPAANPPETRLAMRLAAQWNSENPDVQVRVQPLPAGRSSEEVLLAAIVAKATPDVSSNVSSALLARLVRAGGVVRLDTRVATAARLRERTNSAMLGSLRLPDGGIYAFPWKTNPEMLMYNVDLFKAAGIGPPHTHTELVNAWHKLARDTDGDGRLDRWAMWSTLKTTWYERFYDFYPLYLASSGGKTLVNNGKIVFDNAAALSSLDVLRRGFAEGVLPRSNFALGRDPFMDGTVAMKIIGPWFVKELDELKVRGLHYNVTPVPSADGTDPANQFAFADLRSIAIFSTTRYPDAAARFVAYLTSPAADRLLIEQASQLPYRRGLASDPRFTIPLARWPTLSTYATYVERSRDLDIDPDVVEIFDIISEAYEESAIYQTTSVKAAVKKAAAEARNVVNAR